MRRRETGSSSGTRTQTAGLAYDALHRAALRYLAASDRTEAQLRAYLLRKGASSASLRHVIRRVQDCGYLNDEAYARRWAESRLAQRPMGRRRLEAELSGRGVPGPIMARVLEGLYADLDEVELARRLLSRRTTMPARHLESPAPRRGGPFESQKLAGSRFARMAGMLRRYGFSSETIETVLGAPQEPDREA